MMDEIKVQLWATFDKQLNIVNHTYSKLLDEYAVMAMPFYQGGDLRKTFLNKFFPQRWREKSL
jgi:hypothetical protein